MVCYDGSGVAAAKLAFVLTLLGHDDVAVYDGGWAEWGNRLDLPVGALARRSSGPAGRAPAAGLARRRSAGRRSPAGPRVERPGDGARIWARAWLTATMAPVVRGLADRVGPVGRVGDRDERARSAPAARSRRSALGQQVDRAR